MNPIEKPGAVTRPGVAQDAHVTDDEARLVERIAAGERSQFEQLMRRYNQRLYRIARATLGDHVDAQDAMQEAYLAAYRGIGQFRGDASIGTWLSRLVLNECLGRLRRSERRQNVLPMVNSNGEINTVAGSDSELPDRLLGRAEMRALLERKVDGLPQTFASCSSFAPSRN